MPDFSQIFFPFFSCICKSVDDRPDTVELASQIADKLLVHVDNLRINQITLEKKLEKERKKAQRYTQGESIIFEN